LFEYERRVSVLHFLVKRYADYEDPIKSKDKLMFHCGFRRFEGRPVYSQPNTSCDKNLFERFLHKGRFTVCSLYSRVMFPPANVLLFKPTADQRHEGKSQDDKSQDDKSQDDKSQDTTQHKKKQVKTEDKSKQPSSEESILRDNQVGEEKDNDLGFGESSLGTLVASGTLTCADPARLLIKRVVLTGYPVSVHKRSAIVRYMFFHPDDIRWFKPVQLWTQYGHVGHIIEPRGTKGYMKCLFDNYIKNHDTVCMSLYKRQYPPWDPSLFAGVSSIGFALACCSMYNMYQSQKFLEQPDSSGRSSCFQ